MSSAVDLELVLDTPEVAAGDLLSGRAPGGASEVELVRRERTPGACGSFHVCLAELAADGAFEVAVPADTPPTWTTDRCELTYGVIARRGGRRSERAAVAEEVRITGGRVQAQMDDYPRDRLIASFDARSFHVELSDAVLCGGGWLRGRVHGDDAQTPPGMLAMARLLECWRVDRGWNVRYQPMWREKCLWEAEPAPAEWLEGSTWAPFEFAVPPGMPPGVEGRLLAWRYEVEARRPSRFVPAQRAVVTPIGFQAA
jgi:hypothetical protein